MSRKDEIKKALSNPHGLTSDYLLYYQLGFIEGAKWADLNPQKKKASINIQEQMEHITKTENM